MLSPSIWKVLLSSLHPTMGPQVYLHYVIKSNLLYTVLNNQTFLLLEPHLQSVQKLARKRSHLPLDTNRVLAARQLYDQHTSWLELDVIKLDREICKFFLGSEVQLLSSFKLNLNNVFTIPIYPDLPNWCQTFKTFVFIQIIL